MIKQEHSNPFTYINLNHPNIDSNTFQAKQKKRVNGERERTPVSREKFADNCVEREDIHI